MSSGKESEMKTKKVIGALAAIAAIAALAVLIIISAMNTNGRNQTQLSRDKAVEQLADLVRKKVNVEYKTPTKSTVDLLDSVDLADELPTLKNEDLSVQGRADIVLEVFASPEKGGEKQNAWMCEVAKEFNKEQMTVDGRTIAVSIRDISSGLGMDYITSGICIPDIYSPSNTFWGSMANASGANLEMACERLAGNVAGIVIKNEKYNEIKETYGSIDERTVMQAVIDGLLQFGYTTPNTSSTGQNYVMNSLYRTDPSHPLSKNALDKFTQFQANVPFVAQTTMQMQKAAEKGTLDAFVFESQVWENTPAMRASYTFVPFGIRHDNPAYIPANMDNERRQAAMMFLDYCLQDKYQQLATRYGFNTMDDYVPSKTDFSGEMLLSAQTAWKENKDAGKTIVAMFIADNSGSMKGERINELRKSLINGMRYISERHYVGLGTYNGNVTIWLKPAPFDLNQQSLFKGAVEAMDGVGETATCSAVAAGLQELVTASAQIPDAQPILFLLSDGEQSPWTEVDYDDIHDIAQALGIPIYTISYAETIDLMEDLADINEASNIKADSDDVVYKIKNLFNSNL